MFYFFAQLDYSAGYGVTRSSNLGAWSTYASLWLASLVHYFCGGVFWGMCWGWIAAAGVVGAFGLAVHLARRLSDFLWFPRACSKLCSGGQWSSFIGCDTAILFCGHSSWELWMGLMCTTQHVCCSTVCVWVLRVLCMLCSVCVCVCVL